MSITLNSVSYTYSPRTACSKSAITNVSLHIEKGEFVGIMGPNGSGKTTLINLMAGLIKPDSGEVLLDGENINDKKYDMQLLRRKIGVVFQYPENQLFETTVEKDIAFGLKNLGFAKALIPSMVKDAMSTVGLDYENLKDVSPLSLSGGEKRRVAIAGILASGPEILILDEPTAGLDPSFREDFLDFLSELNRQNITIIMVSHNVNAIVEHAGRVIILKDGTIQKDDGLKSVFTDERVFTEWDIDMDDTGECISLLRKSGIPVPEDILRYDEFISYIIDYIKEKRG
ncbi:MAG: ATP-binding cassette domain-containing protein [Butyrivibrio sp.]